MKNVIKIVAVIVLLLIAGVFLFQETLKENAFDTLTADMFVEEDADSFDPGPAIGTAFPQIMATYQGREISSLQEFQAPNGLVFVATRSAEWCPFCMKQMIQLQEYKAKFDAAGIGLVAITYDEPALQQAFIDKHGIEYPILHDVNTATFYTLGILNEKYQKGDSAYGIPHPGMIVIDSNGQIAGKLFLEAYSVRVSAEASLDYARQMLGLTP